MLNAEYPPIRADPQLEQRIKLGREFPDPANPARARSQFQQQRPGSRRPEPTGAKPGTRGVKKAKRAERRSMCTIRSRSRERSPPKPEETHPSSSACPLSIRRAVEQWRRVETATAGPAAAAAAAFGERSEGLRGAERTGRPARARCEMIGLAVVRGGVCRRSEARRERRRMEATDGGWSRPGWHPSSPGPRVRSRSTTPAVLRRVAARHRAGPRLLSCALRSPVSLPQSHCSTLVHGCTVHMDHYLFFFPNTLPRLPIPLAL